jgi:hypothetical protein
MELPLLSETHNIALVGLEIRILLFIGSGTIPNRDVPIQLSGILCLKLDAIIPVIQNDVE